MMKSKKKSIWVFGDYRNYYQNRVTLQLTFQSGMILLKQSKRKFARWFLVMRLMNGLWNILRTERIEFWRLMIPL
jgi:hypothetical protein